MTREEAIEYWEVLRKTFSSQLEKEENHFGRMHLQTTIDAIEMAISALRQETVTLNEPLTLDELREMDGKPVYCVEITRREGEEDKHELDNTKCKNDNGEHELNTGTLDYEKAKAIEKVCRSVIDGRVKSPDDVAVVVRCQECKHCDPENYHCDHHMGTAAPLRRKPDDLCSYGERKEGADNDT